MSQLSFPDMEFGAKSKLTRRERFLSEMDQVILLARLLKLVETVFPKGKQGRPSYALETMLRIHFMQKWFGLSDPALEDTLHDIQSMRQFASLSLATGSLPDETTILNFSHLLERNQLALCQLSEVNAMRRERGLLLCHGKIVDAPIVSAARSTKNESGERDLEMQQTKKDNNWRFEMKAHSGVDADLGLVHTVTTTLAKEHDIPQANALVHGEEGVIYDDSRYLVVDKREDTIDIKVTWHEVMQPSQRSTIKDKCNSNTIERIEKIKAEVLAKVEHPFRVLKCQFDCRKVKYKGLAENMTLVMMLFAFSNVWMVRRKLMAIR